MPYRFRFDVVWNNMGFLLAGVVTTLHVTLAALSIGIVTGLVVGIARMSRRRWLRAPATGYVEVFRNTPALVQLIWVYYCLPLFTGVNLSATASCIVALALNGSAYLAEIFRGGIQAVDRGLVEASRALGMSYAKTMRKIVLPQACRRMIPPMVNESVALLKFSSLVSILGVADLTYQAQVLSTTTLERRLAIAD